MNEDDFKYCTDKLVKLNNNIDELLSGVENGSIEGIEGIRECLYEIHRVVNK